MEDQQKPSADSTVSPADLQKSSPDILKKATIALDDQDASAEQNPTDLYRRRNCPRLCSLRPLTASDIST